MLAHDDVYGRRVNVAARLTKLAGPGEIVVSGAVRDALASELDAEFEDLGDCYLRNLSRPERSEERRVGKACGSTGRSRGGAKHYKKKNKCILSSYLVNTH